MFFLSAFEEQGFFKILANLLLESFFVLEALEYLDNWNMYAYICVLRQDSKSLKILWRIILF